MKLRESRGFTLIELLVVIAIISILAAILFPVFARARENARRSSCASNLKQISLGVLQYTQDYDEQFPVHSATAATGWVVQLGPYLKSTQIFQCPSDSNVDPTTPGNVGYTDYAMNSMFLFIPPSPVTPRGLSLAAVTHPSLTVILCEDTDNASPGTNTVANFYATGNGNSHQGTAVTARLATFRGTSSTGAAQRHLDGANFAFADGHVKWYRASSPIRSAAVYNWNTPLTTSGDSPTFNPSP